ncbi:M15 family metallopeptidase [Clostridium sp.]|uniref:M15 family metallopeptidase n=1 Tax=Clostridium sp. TaxID=1506 RepID=UPI0032168C90
MKKRKSKKRIKNKARFSIILIIFIVGIGLSEKGIKLLAEKNMEKYNYSRVGNKEKVLDDKEKVLEDKEILMVNRDNPLDKNFVPKNLVTPNTKFIGNGDPNVNKLEAVAARALENLFQAAKDEGIDLLGVSGYRDYNYQKKLYDNAIMSSGKEYANKYTAKPGDSEHQTGLAMDILSEDYQVLDDGFNNTDASRWIEKNCSKYGFIIRYPKGKENITGYNYEPWHLRYVGKKAAEEIMKNKITLEEYIEMKK